MYWIYLYGSYATSNNDEYSDLDYLIVTDGRSAIDDIAGMTRRLAAERFGRMPAISAYHIERIRQLYAEGALFAWHLFEEGELVTSQDGTDLLHVVGEPADYSMKNEELDLFTWMIETIDTDKDYLVHNKELEAGYLFTALRNLGIVFSTDRGRPFDYSTSAILHCSPNIPISAEVYQMYRMVKSHRQTGGTSKTIDLQHFAGDVDLIKAWIGGVREVHYV